MLYVGFLLVSILEIVRPGHCSQPRSLYDSLLSVDQAAWNALNESVSGHLHNGQPMLAPCYTNYNGQAKEADARQCALLQSNGSEGYFISNHFGGYQNLNWGWCQATGKSCSAVSAGASIPQQQCAQGSVPSKYIEVHGVEDVQKGLAFASQHNLRLVIKNTGHDYKGRSSAPDSFALWTHQLRPPIQLRKGFIPEGCSSAVGDAITFGAGQQFQEIYEFAHDHNYRVVGGSCNSVGAAGGWVTGGGHSLLSNELGLGVDNAQELKVVLPNGTYITANRCQNQDMFFALRGGGGGTFGVIMEMSTLAHEEKPMEVGVITIPTADREDLIRLLSIVVDHAEKWSLEGWGGEISLGLPEQGGSRLSLITSLLNHDQAVLSLKPVLDLAAQMGSSEVRNVTTKSGFYETYSDMRASGRLELSGASVAMSSRIVPRESFISEHSKRQLCSILADVVEQSANSSLRSFRASRAVQLTVVAPALYSRNMPASDLPGGPGYSSVTPAWRDGLWHVMNSATVLDTATAPDSIRRVWKENHNSLNALREFTPGSGAYQNEADPFEPDPIDSFWGRENYDRLLDIKRNIDPMNLLTVHQGVGWNGMDDRYHCYPDVLQ